MERKSLNRGGKQTRVCVVQGLRIGSSSSVMLRLIGHGIVSETNFAAGDSQYRRLISSSKWGLRGGVAVSEFQAQFAAFPSGQSNSNFQSARFGGSKFTEGRA